MDPRTTLFTFMLETKPSVQSVQLFGSWDNFGKPYKMERDARRDRGQWKGCHSFDNMSCHDEKHQQHQQQQQQQRRDAGLKMGQPYYFYYELDGCMETHNPLLPSTTACPYLPGQMVNTMMMPIEQSLRKRSASLTSLRHSDYMTVDPDDKFISPRPAPPVPGSAVFRLPTASSPIYNTQPLPQPQQQPQPHTSMVHHILRHKRSARSMSPTQNWSWSPRKLFSRKSSVCSQGSDGERVDSSMSIPWAEPRSGSSSSRSRDISPESLRRFLSDDTLYHSDPIAASPLSIPDEIVEEAEDEEEEEEEEDFTASFATRRLSDEDCLQSTILSPPPFRRQQSPATTLTASHNASRSQDTIRAFTTIESLPSTNDTQDFLTATSPTSTPIQAINRPAALNLILPSLPSRFSVSSDGSAMPEVPSLTSPSPSPSPSNSEQPTFYHSEEDEDLPSPANDTSFRLHQHQHITHDREFAANADMDDDTASFISFLPLQGIPSHVQPSLRSQRSGSGSGNDNDHHHHIDRDGLGVSPKAAKFLGYGLPLDDVTASKIRPATSAGICDKSVVGGHGDDHHDGGISPPGALTYDFVNELKWMAEVIQGH